MINLKVKLTLIFTSLIITISNLPAQKFGYVDTEFILNQMPEYKAAKAEINKNTADWQKEIEAKYEEIKKLYETYQAERILLSDDLCKKREKEIADKEKDAKSLQQLRFGSDGDLFKKRMELVKPIQDKIYNAVKAVAESSKMAIIFDKANDMLMIHANAKYDKSEDVLNYLGVSRTKSGNGGSNSHKKK